MVDFRDYVTAADAMGRRVAVRFNVSLIDEAGGETHMANCNFFEIDAAGQLTDILIFASSPLSKGFEAGSG